MKHLLSFAPAARAAGLGLLLALSALCAQAQGDAAATPGDGREGTFKTVQGDVTLVRGNTRNAAVVGAGLQLADRVLTGPASATAVVLKDGTTLSIGPDSALDLSEFSFDPTTQEGSLLVALARGSLRMVTGLIAKLRPEQVKVTTPTTVIGVRGTDFIVEQRP
ncbi:MAG: FecR family protein [Pseudomonadota bacterium]|nr:FecR family protein [Pseudomonadota bacterium]